MSLEVSHSLSPVRAVRALELRFFAAFQSEMEPQALLPSVDFAAVIAPMNFLAGLVRRQAAVLRSA